MLAQTPAQFDARLCLIQRVEVQTRGAGRKQPLAQIGDDVQAEFADRVAIVTEAFEAPSYPSGNFGAAGIRKARELREADDRHDAGHDWNVAAQRCDVIDES